MTFVFLNLLTTVKIILKTMFTDYYDIDTPALLVDNKKMLNNITKMQNIADTAGVKLRPHTKTHKTPDLARLQLEHGAGGIAVAKLSEAEVMAEYGFDDIQIANIIIGSQKMDRLIKLRQKIKNLSCNVDSIQSAQELSEKFKISGGWIDVFIEINSGHNRNGTNNYNDIYLLAKFIEQSQGLNFVGLFTHAGHVYSAKSIEEVKAIGENEGGFLVSIANKLMNQRILVTKISVGSTPTAKYCSKINGVTEIRPGNYIFYDMMQTGLGSCSIDECALTVLATVISKSEDRIIIDAGAKSLSLERGIYGNKDLDSYGLIIGKENSKITRLSEEHGIVENPSDNFYVGEKIRIIPNHVCSVVNLFDTIFITEENKITAQYDIKARGMCQ